MKKVFLLLCVATMAFSAMAQTESKPPGTDDKSTPAKHHPRGKDIQEQMKSLNLTEEQKKQVQDLNTTMRQQMQELQKTGSLTVDEQKARKKALQKQYRSDLEKLLTDEQKVKWHELRKEHAKEGHGQGDNHDKHGKPEAAEKEK